MKKQQQCEQQFGANASQKLHQRLITRETYQLVNSKKYGTAASRNERHLAKQMKSLHLEQSKKLAKLRDEIHEMRTHRKQLREVDETARDPRTTEAKNKLDGFIGKDGEMMRLNLGRSFDFDRSPRLPIRKQKITEDRPKSMIDKLHLTDVKLRPIMDSPTLSRSTPAFLSGLMDMKSKRDPSMKKWYKNGLDNNEKSGREKQPLTMPELVQNTKVSHFASNTRVNNIDTVGSNGIKPNKRAIGPLNRTRSESFTKKISGDNNLSALAPFAPPLLGHHYNDGKTCKRRVHCPQGYFVVKSTGDNDASSSTDDETLERNKDAAKQTENLSEIMSTCRYLRKPKGHETPEMTIEAIFQ